MGLLKNLLGRKKDAEKIADELALKAELRAAKGRARKKWAKKEAMKLADERYKKPSKKKKNFFDMEKDFEDLAKGPDIPGF